jgi:PBP1b-binding outer membrane lipoprotein LpoB
MKKVTFFSLILMVALAVTSCGPKGSDVETTDVDTTVVDTTAVDSTQVESVELESAE